MIGPFILFAVANAMSGSPAISDNIVEMFAGFCLKSFPNIEKVRSGAKDAGWTELTKVKRPIRAGENTIPAGRIFFGKNEYTGTVGPSGKDVSHISCEVATPISDQVTMTGLAKRLATSFHLPNPAQISEDENEVAWEFRDGRHISATIVRVRGARHANITISAPMVV